MVRKCKGIGEVAVMELAQVGGKTRARSLAMAEASVGGATKRRKLGGGESESGSASSSGDFGEIAHEDRTPSAVPEGAPESCCSSNGSSKPAKGSGKFSDPDQVELVSRLRKFLSWPFDCSSYFIFGFWILLIFLCRMVMEYLKRLRILQKGIDAMF